MRNLLLAILVGPVVLALSADDGCGGTDPESCPRLPGPDDALRHVVVSHPYDDAGRPADTYELLELSVDGVLTRTGTSFQMGKSTYGEVVFTPDGEVGLVVQDDGTLGVFLVEEDGRVTVVHQAFEGSFYAGAVVMDPSGQRAWVVDPNWRENGGGIYSVQIGCDGRLKDDGMAAPAKLAYAMEYLPDGSFDALVAARDVLDSAPGHDAHILDLTEEVTQLGGADAFGDDDAIVSALTVTRDARYGLIADNNFFSGTGNRVAVVDVMDMAPVQVLQDIEDPIDVVASPYDNAAVVVSGYGNAVIVLDYTPGSSLPFSRAGEVSYIGARPQLPGSAVMLERGGLTGWMFLAENVGVRQLRFEPDGRVTDLGLTSFGSGYTSIVGAVGVQP